MNVSMVNICISNPNTPNPTPRTVWIDIKVNQTAKHNFDRPYKCMNSITKNDQKLAKVLYNKAVFYYSMGTKGSVSYKIFIERAAKRGHAEAQYRFGTFRFDGIGEPKNLNEGFKYMKLSADQRHAEAQYFLAICYEREIGVEKDINKAFQYAKLSAKQGLAKAQNRLALYFCNGQGTKKNLKESRIQLELAAKQGYAAAQYGLAHFLIDGTGGGEINLGRAQILMKLSADQGYKEAVDYLSRYTSKETPKVNSEKSDNTLSDDQELAKDFYTKANFFLTRTDGNKDFKQAFTLMEMAANKGHIEAQLDLGLFYKDGIGTEINYKKAFHFTQLSAKQGLVKAQSRLALYYWQGIGTKVDLMEAKKWLQLASDQGFANAQFGLGHFLFNGIAGEKNVKEAERLMMLSADQGFDAAIDFLNNMKANDLFNRARSYLEGSTEDFDFEEGSRLMQEAAEAGHAEAKLYLGF